MKHTPTPRVSEDDAQFIVKACNHHDELVEALEDCLGFIDELKDHGIDNWSGEMKVHHLLKKVKQ